MHNPNLIFSIIAASVTLGGILIAAGVLKGKVNQNTETNKAQDEQIKTRASKAELEAAINRSNEILAIMKERAEEDRAKGQGQYREFYALLTGQEKRIIALETQQTAFAKVMDELKQDLKSGFRDIQSDLKEIYAKLEKSRGLD